MKLSYAITVKDELEEVTRLIEFLIKYKRKEDEIIILFDTGGSVDVHVYLDSIDHEDIFIIQDRFKGNFADWKNLLTSYCTGDYIFQIDADEYPDEVLAITLPEILELTGDVDIILVPRVNTVKGITEAHIRKWGWSMNDKGWINFPDFQWRIYKNSSHIKWKNKVHEVLTGYKSYATLPERQEYSLYHPKTIERQEKQNSSYERM